MKLVREHINEKFTEDSDPIHDMRIGLIHKVEEWLKEMGISNYTINDDLSIDVNHSVDLEHKLNGNLPNYIQFNKITNGYFCIDRNNMTSLKGCPISIDKGISGYYGNFQCKDNMLLSLKYAPKSISGYFMCEKNKKKFTKKEVRKYCKHIGIEIIN